MPALALQNASAKIATAERRADIRNLTLATPARRPITCSRLVRSDVILLTYEGANGEGSEHRQHDQIRNDLVGDPSEAVIASSRIIGIGISSSVAKPTKAVTAPSCRESASR